MLICNVLMFVGRAAMSSCFKIDYLPCLTIEPSRTLNVDDGRSSILVAYTLSLSSLGESLRLMVPAPSGVSSRCLAIKPLSSLDVMSARFRFSDA